MTKQSVRDDGDSRKYYAAIPNIIFRIGLNPYELALYIYLKTVAGEDGVCWKSTATIARELKMGAGTVSRTKALLARPCEAVGGKPLILVTTEMQNGGNPNHAIRITDIWPENMAELARVRAGKATRSTGDARVPETSATPSTGEPTRSSGELKNNPIRNTNEEELRKEPQHALRADTRGTRLPDDFGLNSEMREWAALKTPHVNADDSLVEFVDYWRGVPGQRGKKLDWPATWRNRMRELEGRARKNGNGNGTSKSTGYQTAPERRDASVHRRLAAVAELRSRSKGTVN